MRDHPLVRQFVAFFFGSALGLLIDLAGFALLHWLGIDPAIANAISATASITVVYLFITRRAFGRRAHWSTYVVFFGWYLGSIVFFSLLIKFLAESTHLDALWWKLASVPVSFLLNYLFSRLLFTKLLPGPEEGGDDAAQ